jgi:tRNA G46 methylase TrmB
MENEMSELLKIFDKHDCDKGSRKHFYNEVYEPHFEKVRNDPINILEIGVFLGESTAAFHEYFPNANIYGIDIFGNVYKNLWYHFNLTLLYKHHHDNSYEYYHHTVNSSLDTIPILQAISFRLYVTAKRSLDQNVLVCV